MASVMYFSMGKGKNVDDLASATVFLLFLVEWAQSGHWLSKNWGVFSKKMDRHVSAYKLGEKLCKPYKRRIFPHIYTEADNELFAETGNMRVWQRSVRHSSTASDSLHGTVRML